MFFYGISPWLFQFFDILDPIESVDRFTNTSKVYSNFIILTGYLSFFYDKLKFKKFWWPIFLFALVMGELEFFEVIIYKNLIQGVFPNFHINPQYPRMIFAFVGFIFAGLCLAKKRNFFSFFSFASIGVVCVTSALFHFIMIEGVLADYKKESLKKYNIFSSLSLDSLAQTCQSNNLFCYIIEKNKPQLIGSSSNIVMDIIIDNDLLIPKEELIAKLPTIYLKHSREKNKTLEIFEYFRDFNFDPNPVNYFAIENQRDNRHVLIIDLFGLEKKKDRMVRYFYSLSIFAHLFWAIFIILLESIHRDIDQINIKVK